MDMRLQERFTVVEEQRARAIAAVAALPETVRSLAMSGSAWTPAQMLAHCAMAEQEMVRRIALTAESGTGGLHPTRSPLFPLALFILRHPFAALPAPAEMDPPSDISLEAAARNWELVRSDFRGWMETVDDPQRAVLLVHPILGPLSALQALALIEAHGAYHAKRHVARLESRRNA